uniref:Uncharacterized protein n=1 Tax=Aegilops tauschii subsp. strangulata TaxID=200361 RepID=A0A453KC99_AEGTS
MRLTSTVLFSPRCISYKLFSNFFHLINFWTVCSALFFESVAMNILFFTDLVMSSIN